MSHIALLHPQCVRLGGAIQMALQTAKTLQNQGHTVTLYTFEHSTECFPDLQEGVDIVVWNKAQNIKGGFLKKSVTFLFSLLFFLSPKCFHMVTLAFHLRHVDIIVANNPPMQVVAALAKVFSMKYKGQNTKDKVKNLQKNKNPLFCTLYSVLCHKSTIQTIWWHHHVPWYYIPKNKAERINNKGGIFIHLKSFFEKYCIIPFIDEMIVTSHFVADCVLKYCGREATVIHPVIHITPLDRDGKYPRSTTTAQNREYPRSTTTPLKGGLEQELIQTAEQELEPELEPEPEPELDLELQTSAPFKGLLTPSGEKGYASSEATIIPSGEKGYVSETGSQGIATEAVSFEKSGYGNYTHPANTKLQSFSHQMSRQMTRAEQRLWFEVLQSEKTGYKWVKQKIIGNFIVDFYCHEKRLVIEVDGGIHQDQQDYDDQRTKYLKNLGIRVIRYTNEIVLNQIDQVREKVQWELEQEIVDTYPRFVPQHPHCQTPITNQGGVSPGKGNWGTGTETESDTGTCPSFKGGESQHKIGGIASIPEPDPYHQPIISSPLKGALEKELAPNTVTLFTHGRLEPGKGIDMLVSVFQALVASSPFKESLIPNEKKEAVSETEPSAPFKGLLTPIGEKRYASSEVSIIPNEKKEAVLVTEPSAPFKGLLISSGEKGYVSETGIGGIASTPEPDPYPQPIISSPLKGALGNWRTGTETESDTGANPPFKGVAGNAGGMAISTALRLIVFGTGSLEGELTKMGIEVRPFDREHTFRELSTGHYGHVLGVYCSEIDAFGMASLESQMAGLSTVILDRGGASEAILSDDHDEPVGYLVDSEEHLGATISHYVQYKTFPKHMSNVNFLHTKDYFSTTRLSSDLLSAITKTSL